MKRAFRWDNDNSDSSSNSDSDRDSSATTAAASNQYKPQGKSARHKVGRVDFESLKQHGYKGGLSLLDVPPQKDDNTKQDWSWSTGRERPETREEVQESYHDRQKTRAAILDAEQLANVPTSKDKKCLSFSQKEKRKRDLGQASRGKNYVEEEKRLLRESGVYSGFDA